MQIDTLAEHLYVCTGSGELFGPLGPDRAPPAYEQRCRWTQCSYRARRWHRPRTALPEPPGDFACAVELCHCCASALIPSGSRFSSFFCDECRRAARQLAESAGFAVIPLGRHALMNGICLDGANAADPQRLAALCAASRWLARSQPTRPARAVALTRLRAISNETNEYLEARMARSIYVYCVFCSRAGLRADLRSGARCKYPDCEGSDSNAAFKDWDELRANNPELPNVPGDGIKYFPANL